MAKRFNLIDLEIQEEYILTKEEEDAAIAWEISQKKNHYLWRIRQVLATESEVMLKVSQVDWEKEINREQVLRVANSNKQADLWHQQQREKQKEDDRIKLAQLKEKYSAQNMFRFMQGTSKRDLGKPLIVNDHNKLLITALCYFLSHNPHFETELGFSFQKGILIRGISGIGKTHLVKCLEKNELNPILILSMLEITDEIKAEGEYELRMGDNKLLYLDDVGTEEATVNHYGTKINWFKNFIESYYLRNKTYNRLIISTNNNFSEMEEKYGFRVRSRIKDMFNVITLTGEDMRG